MIRSYDDSSMAFLPVGDGGLGAGIVGIVRGMLAFQLVNETGCDRAAALAAVNNNFPTTEAPTAQSLFDWYDRALATVLLGEK